MFKSCSKVTNCHSCLCYIDTGYSLYYISLFFTVNWLKRFLQIVSLNTLSLIFLWHKNTSQQVNWHEIFWGRDLSLLRLVTMAFSTKKRSLIEFRCKFKLVQYQTKSTFIDFLDKFLCILFIVFQGITLKGRLFFKR